jgi:hypothetical protein
MRVVFKGAHDDDDVRILASPEFLDAFAEAITEALRPGAEGWTDEVFALYSPWDFEPKDVQRPITWWHGRHDANAPLVAAERFIARIPVAELRVWDDDGHLACDTKHCCCATCSSGADRPADVPPFPVDAPKSTASEQPTGKNYPHLEENRLTRPVAENRKRAAAFRPCLTRAAKPALGGCVPHRCGLSGMGQLTWAALRPPSLVSLLNLAVVEERESWTVR